MFVKKKLLFSANNLKRTEEVHVNLVSEFPFYLIDLLTFFWFSVGILVFFKQRISVVEFLHNFTGERI